MKIPILIVSIFLLTLSGCISKKSQINFDSISMGIPFEGKIENIFVVIDLPDNVNYSEKLAQSLKEQFQEQNIQCASYIKKSKIDLNTNKEFTGMAVKSGASYILTIDLFSQLYDPNYYKTLKALHLNIYDLEGKMQYTASLDQDLRMIKNANQAKNDATLIVQELRKNNLLKE